MAWYDSVIGAAVNTAADVVGGAWNDRRTERDRKRNYYYSQMAAEADLSRQQWLLDNYYTPRAQLGLAKEAGLSPSLMAKNMGSAGGANVSNSGGGGELQTPAFYTDPLKGAQVELMRAQARKANAEADTENGDNERGQAFIAKTWSEKGLNDELKRLNNLVGLGQEIQNEINGKTKDEQIKIVKSKADYAAYEAEEMFWNVSESALQYNFDLDTYNENFKRVIYTNKKILQDIAESKSNIELNEAQIEEINQSIVDMWVDQEVKWQNAEEYKKYVEGRVNNMEKEIEVRLKELGVAKWRIVAGVVTDLIRTAGYIAGATQYGDGGYIEYDETQTFDKKGNPQGTVKHTAKKTKMPKRLR